MITVSLAYSMFGSWLVCLAYLSFFSSLYCFWKPSTDETAALATPGDTATWKGDPGKATRSPLALGSHQRCSSHVPACVGLYVRK